MKKLLAVFFLPLTLLAADPVWDAPIPSSQGRFSVRLSSIGSLALESYNLKYEDKTIPVVECSVAMAGGKTARFYYIEEKNEEEGKKDPFIEPLQNALAAAAPATQNEDEDDNPNLRVVKAYPESALAATVEYRLGSQQAVISLYSKLRKDWEEFLAHQ